MPLSFSLNLSNGPLEFVRMVSLTHVKGTFDGYPMVWFADYDQDLAQERSGVVVVVQDEKQVVYCAALKKRSFAQTWLYADGGFLFKQRTNAAKAIDAGFKLEIYLSTRGRAGDADRIISEQQPPWHRRR